MPPGACGRPRGRNTEARNALTDGRKRHCGISAAAGDFTVSADGAGSAQKRDGMQDGKRDGMQDGKRDGMQDGFKFI